ncbi:endoglucanase II, partial [Coprinopsis marcescibilis]
MKAPLFVIHSALLLHVASAHSIFQELYVNGVSQGHLNGIRVPSLNHPVYSVDSKDIICNTGLVQPVSEKVISVPSGAELTTEWHPTTNNDPSWAGSDPLPSDHRGPILAYLAKVKDARQADVEGLKWFKIYHEGYDQASRLWASQKLINNKGKVSFKVPTCIESGQYLLRVEIVALHGATKVPGAQVFLSCAQLEITGGGNVTPAAVASFPGAYNGAHPRNAFSRFAGDNSPDLVYHLPGPPVFNCQTPNVPWTPIFIPGVIPVAQYGQCGGIGYNGSTLCHSQYTCVKQNDHVSAC